MKHITLFFCGLMLFFSSLSQAEPLTYTVFIVPELSEVELRNAWTPELSEAELRNAWTQVLKKLSQATKLQFELKILPTIPEFERIVVFNGEADFVFMNPYHQVVAKRTQGYIPLVRDQKSLEGWLLVKKDSPLKSLSELNGKKVAFPAPNAFAASLYPRALLAQRGIKIVPDYVKTHSNVYRAVLLGDVVAGGGVNNTLQREEESVQQQLKVFYTTPKFAPHPFSAHPHIAEAIRNQVTKSFVLLAADPANAALLNKIQIPNPVPADYLKDYKPLEALSLDRFFVEENP